MSGRRSSRRPFARPRAGSAARDSLETRWSQLPVCAQCALPEPLCLCAIESPLVVAQDPTLPRILILQHPQEQRRLISSVPILERLIPQARVVRGLSWRNLSQAWQQKGETTVLNPSEWGVLYLGSVKMEAEWPAWVTVDGTGKRTYAEREGAQAFKGLILLDGTWSHAKTLWWRNAWLLRMKRIVLRSNEPGLFAELRREPNARSLSTLESVGRFLELSKPGIRGALEAPFAEWLKLVRRPPASPAPDHPAQGK